MLNDNLKANRIKCNLTQEQAAEQLHVVRQTVSKWEKGLSVPDADQLVAISKIYQVSVGALLDEPAGNTVDRGKIYEKLNQITEQIQIRNHRKRQFWLAVTIAGVVITIWGAVGMGFGVYNYNASFNSSLADEALNQVLSSSMQIFMSGSRKLVVGFIVILFSRIAAHKTKMTTRA